MERMKNWYELITMELHCQNETWEDVLGHTLAKEDLEKKFDCGYGSTEGEPFTLWTKNRVYFPACYDGAEWVESVPRNPCEEKISHVGGC